MLRDIGGQDLVVSATTTPNLFLRTSEGDAYQTWVVMNGSDDVLRWNEQSLPGDDVGTALGVLANGTFSVGEDAAFSLDLWGSGRDGRSDRGDDLLEAGDDRSEVRRFTYEEVNITVNTDDAGGMPDLNVLLEAYRATLPLDLSYVDLSGSDLSERDFGVTDLSRTNLSGADLTGANLSGALMIGTDLSGADLSGVDLTGAVWAPVLSPFEPPTPGFTGANLSDADLTGLFGIDLTGLDLNTTADLTGAICPDGVLADESGCAGGFSQIPPSAIAPLFMAPGAVNITVTPYDLDLRYVGTHEFIPGVPSATLSSSIIIGEGSWRGFIGNEAVDNHTATTWTFALPDVDGDDLKGLRASIEADSRVGSASDWKTAHEAVERNGGLIFGTQGLLSLQFVVASLAAVASSFVFLSLVLTQRQKELAILQAIGAAPGQIIRLVLFEILSIVLMSMALGVALGIGLALSFNGFFEVFGFIFQIFQSDGNTLTITRNLVYPWASLALVSASVFGAVVLALLITTRRTLAADLASVLKGE
ncbi:MAG TPA: FtsX-like permease family protein [Candidatus Poseidoniales archaeon]|nr:MAG TPA: FtsX-like permease family protein [Candidatus Poseidoniales archaeon]